jgi:hypothetical protein
VLFTDFVGFTFGSARKNQHFTGDEVWSKIFECDYRSKVAAKNKAEIEMYFVNGIHPELSLI